jgi:hypothetical protein
MRKEINQNSSVLIIDVQAENVLLLERTLRTAGYPDLDNRKMELCDETQDLVW